MGIQSKKLNKPNLPSHYEPFGLCSVVSFSPSTQISRFAHWEGVVGPIDGPMVANVGLHFRRDE